MYDTVMLHKLVNNLGEGANNNGLPDYLLIWTQILIYHVIFKYNLENWKIIWNQMYDILDEFPMGNQSLMDIINLKQLHNLLQMVFYPRGIESIHI